MKGSEFAALLEEYFGPFERRAIRLAVSRAADSIPDHAQRRAIRYLVNNHSTRWATPDVRDVLLAVKESARLPGQRPPPRYQLENDTGEPCLTAEEAEPYLAKLRETLADLVAAKRDQ